MPYIKNETKPDALIYQKNSGELNFFFTRAINDYIRDHGLKYETLNDIRGALENCTSEFYDRIVRPYEDRKIRENGDAYDADLIEQVHGVGGGK
jgi:hypothetical protein